MIKQKLLNREEIICLAQLIRNKTGKRILLTQSEFSELFGFSALKGYKSLRRRGLITFEGGLFKLGDFEIKSSKELLPKACLCFLIGCEKRHKEEKKNGRAKNNNRRTKLSC